MAGERARRRRGGAPSRYDGRSPTPPPPPMRRPTLAPCLILAATLLAAPLARADGLADLRAALARLQAQTPLKATLEVKTSEQQGEGADAVQKEGEASIALEDGARGLQVLYSRDLIARMEAESRQLVRDPQAKTPTVWALDKLDTSDVLRMASAANALGRRLDESVFKSEKADTFGGRPARLLTFTSPLSRLPVQQRKYVKEFDSTLSVWIAADGTPLASATNTLVKGRAFVVVSFEAVDEDKLTYGVVGDRLMTLRSESHTASSGAGERGERRVVRTLQPQG